MKAKSAFIAMGQRDEELKLSLRYCESLYKIRNWPLFAKDAYLKGRNSVRIYTRLTY